MILSSCDTLDVAKPTDEWQDTEAVKTDSVKEYHGFSVWRIAQSMPNATPQELDSVIQARLPERERHRSTRPDTLSIPGLEAKSTITKLEDLPVCYKMSYFQNDTLLHPEIIIRPSRYSATPLPYRLWRDNWITGTVLLCFFVMAFIIHLNGKQLLTRSRSFFFGSQHQNEPRAIRTSLEEQSTIIMTFMLCLIGGLGFFEYTQNHLELFLGRLSPYILLGSYIGCWMVYFILKNLLYTFINWIFFDKDSHLLWVDTYSFLLIVESILMYGIIVIGVYFGLMPKNIFYAALSVIIAIKSLLLYKAHQIFFPEIHGSLHLFVYFCTLELVPLLAIARILMWITDLLIVNY